jgi:hypothetical protein
VLLGLGDVVALTRSRSLHTGTPGQHTACMLPSASAGADMCSADAEQRRAARARPRLDGHQRGRRGQQQVQAGGQQLVAEQPRGVQHALQEVRQHLRAHPALACAQAERAAVHAAPTCQAGGCPPVEHFCERFVVPPCA